MCEFDSVTRVDVQKDRLLSSVFGQLDLVFTFYRSDPLTDIFPIHSFRPFPNDSILPSSSFSASKLSLGTIHQSVVGREKMESKNIGLDRLATAGGSNDAHLRKISRLMNGFCSAFHVVFICIVITQ